MVSPSFPQFSSHAETSSFLSPSNKGFGRIDTCSPEEKEVKKEKEQGTKDQNKKKKVGEEERRSKRKTM
jgi:hypothetical protein